MRGPVRTAVLVSAAVGGLSLGVAAVAMGGSSPPSVQSVYATDGAEEAPAGETPATTPGTEAPGTSVPTDTAPPPGVVVDGYDNPAIEPPFEVVDLPADWRLKVEDRSEFGGRTVTVQTFTPSADAANQGAELSISAIEGITDAEEALSDLQNAQTPFPVEYTRTTIRGGQPAVVGYGGTAELGYYAGISWVEGGRQITVIAHGLPERDVRSLVDTMEVAAP